MADVEMTDAPPGSSSEAKFKAVVKAAKTDAVEAGSSDKKRFEVKKVRKIQRPSSFEFPTR